MTHAEEIMRAVAVLTKRRRVEFSRREIRDQLRIDKEEWNRRYDPVFQGMRELPGKAPKVDRRFTKVFRRISHGRYVLTERGSNLPKNLIVNMPKKCLAIFQFFLFEFQLLIKICKDILNKISIKLYKNWRF